jgi:hypothetical protein
MAAAYAISAYQMVDATMMRNGKRNPRIPTSIYNSVKAGSKWYRCRKLLMQEKKPQRSPSTTSIIIGTTEVGID